LLGEDKFIGNKHFRRSDFFKRSFEFRRSDALPNFVSAILIEHYAICGQWAKIKLDNNLIEILITDLNA